MTETVHAVTDDGWRIALRRYEPSGPTRRKHPVVLCHGLGANHIAFDVAPDFSVARYLAGRGYLAFVVDLRGHGDSERPTRSGPHRYGWSFDDYLHQDVPAAIALAKRLAGTDAVHWIGHSMGGILGFAHLARGGSRDFRSLVTVGSSLDYSGSPSGFHRIAPLRGLLRRIPAVPVDFLSRVNASFVGLVETPFERFNVWPSNVDPALWKLVARRGFHPVSPPVMEQLATAMEQGGLRSRDGAVAYIDGLRTATTPVLAIAGTRDPQCPPAAAQRTIDAVGSPRRELRVFGREHGHADEYGHWDLLIGRRAADEVYPHVDRWIDESD
jgi:pimeloyl-ACP methyl ester carboxylesterase